MGRTKDIAAAEMLEAVLRHRSGEDWGAYTPALLFTMSSYQALRGRASCFPIGLANSEGGPELSAPQQPPPEGIWQVANHPREWIQRVKGAESRYYRAIGSAEALMLKAADLGQRWIKGVSREFALKKIREQPVPW